MGMFDEIQCKIPLPAKRGFKPAKFWKEHTFQTKDLDNFLAHYEIRKSGLWVKEIEYKEPDPSKKKKKLRDWFPDPLEIESEKWVRDNFTGYLSFYDFMSDVDDTNDLWIEFRVHLKDGKPQGKVELMEWRLEDNLEKKENLKEWGRETKARKEYEKKLRYKYCFKYWNKLIRFLFYWDNKCHNWWNSKRWKMERWLTF
jgi:hypothetical protein